MRGCLFALVGMACCVAADTATAESTEPASLDLATIASQEPTDELEDQFRQNWASLCETHSVEELTTNLRPLAKKLAKPPLPAMHDAPLTLREGNEDFAIFDASAKGIWLPYLLGAFEQGDCIAKDEKLVRTYRNNVTYRLGPDIYRMLQHRNGGPTNIWLWSEWITKQAPLELDRDIKDPVLINQLLVNRAWDDLIDMRQTAPLFMVMPEENMRSDLGIIFRGPYKFESFWDGTVDQLATIFQEGPAAFLKIADDIHDGKIAVQSPDNAEFDWTKLAYDASVLRTNYDEIILSLNAVDRYIGALLDGRLRQARGDEGLSIDRSAEHTQAYDLIMKMADKGYLFSYRHAYCVISADSELTNTDDGQSLRLKLLEALKQADEPYDERAYNRLKDNVSLFTALGAKISAWRGDPPFKREDLKGDDIDIGQCMRRMNAVF